MIQLQTTVENLKALLEIPAVVANRKAEIPVMSFLRIEVNEQGARAMGMSSNMAIESRSNEVTGQQGIALIPAHKTLDILRSLPADKSLTLKHKGNEQLVMQCGRGRYTLSTLPPDTFPRIDMGNTEVKAKIVLDQADLLKALTHSSYAAAKNDVRHFLNGVLLEQCETHINFVATNGHRLSRYRIEQPGSPVSSILPGDAITVVLKLLKNSKEGEKATIEVASSFARFHVGNISFTTKLIDSKYPDYEKVIPKPNGSSVRISRSELLESVLRSGIFADEKSHGLRLKIEGEELEVFAETRDSGESQERITCRTTFSEPVLLGVNMNYLKEPLGLLDGDEVVLHINLQDNGAPMLIVDEKTPELTTIVMPLKV